MAAVAVNNCLGSRSCFHGAASFQRASNPRQLSQLRSCLYSSQAHLSSWEDARQCSWSLQQTMPEAHSTNLPKRQVVRMGKTATGGVFAPLVSVVRNIMGEKEFNKLRGKGISLHSQVIKDFCKQVGVDPKQVQGVIRLAKKNGEKLGFLS